MEDKEVGELWRELREGEANHKIYSVIGINLIRKLVEERAWRRGGFKLGEQPKELPADACILAWARNDFGITEEEWSR
jgi:hypothetical protein